MSGKEFPQTQLLHHKTSQKTLTYVLLFILDICHIFQWKFKTCEDLDLQFVYNETAWFMCLVSRMVFSVLFLVYFVFVILEGAVGIMDSSFVIRDGVFDIIFAKQIPFCIQCDFFTPAKEIFRWWSNISYASVLQKCKIKNFLCIFILHLLLKISAIFLHFYKKTVFRQSLSMCLSGGSLI